MALLVVYLTQNLGEHAVSPWSSNACFLTEVDRDSEMELCVLQLLGTLLLAAQSRHCMHSWVNATDAPGGGRAVNAAGSTQDACAQPSLSSAGPASLCFLSGAWAQQRRSEHLRLPGAPLRAGCGQDSPHWARSFSSMSCSLRPPLLSPCVGVSPVCQSEGSLCLLLPASSFPSRPLSDSLPI